MMTWIKILNNDHILHLLVHFLLKIFLLMLFMMLMVDCFGEAIISSESPLGLCSSWHHNLSPDWLCTMLPCCPRRLSSVCGAASASWSRAPRWPGLAWCPQQTQSSPDTHMSHVTPAHTLASHLVKALFSCNLVIVRVSIGLSLLCLKAIEDEELFSNKIIFTWQAKSVATSLSCHKSFLFPTRIKQGSVLQS